MCTQELWVRPAYRRLYPAIHCTYVFTPFTLDLNLNVVSLATPCRWCPPSTLNGTFSPLQCVWGRWSRPRQCWEKAISPRWITSLSETGENSTLLGTDVHNSGLWPPPVYSSSTSPVVWFRSNSPSKLVGPPVQDLFPTWSVELPVQGGFAWAKGLNGSQNSKLTFASKTRIWLRVTFRSDSTLTPTKTHWSRDQSMGRVLERISELEDLKIDHFQARGAVWCKISLNVYTLKLPISRSESKLLVDPLLEPPASLPSSCSSICTLRLPHWGCALIRNELHTIVN